MSVNRPETNRLELVQALRALAALAVVFGHAQHEASLFAAAKNQTFNTILMERTGAGVDLFFVISGFVMIYASQKLFAANGAAKIFLFRRIARIVPLYWAITSLFLLVLFASPALLSSGAPSPGEIVKSYLFIPYATAGSDIMQPVFKLGWTLNYEMFFYTLLACVIALPRRRAVAALLAGLSGLVVAGLFVRSGDGPFTFWTHPIILEFGIGALLASLRLDGIRLSRGIGWVFAALALLWLALAPVPDAGTAYDAFRPLLWGVPAALLLAGATLNDSSSLRGTGAKTATLLGDASYSIYLLHPMLIRVLRILWDKTAPVGTSPWLFVFAVVAATIVLSLLAYRWFERPVTTRLQAWGKDIFAPSALPRVS
jgi:exopolysaccharide production protein ExoZ